MRLWNRNNEYIITHWIVTKLSILRDIVFNVKHYAINLYLKKGATLTNRRSILLLHNNINSIITKRIRKRFWFWISEVFFYFFTSSNRLSRTGSILFKHLPNFLNCKMYNNIRVLKTLKCFASDPKEFYDWVACSTVLCHQK